MYQAIVIFCFIFRGLEFYVILKYSLNKYLLALNVILFNQYLRKKTEYESCKNKIKITIPLLHCSRVYGRLRLVNFFSGLCSSYAREFFFIK